MLESFNNLIVLHASVETLYAWFLVSVGALFIDKHQREPEGPYFYWAVGSFASASIMLPHILLPVFLSQELKDVWVPITWAAERFIFFGSLLLGMVDVATGKKLPKLMPYSIFGIAALLLAISFAFDFNWANQKSVIAGISIWRPLEFPIIGIIILIGLLAKNGKVAPYMFSGFGLLFALSLIIHGLMMLLSKEFMDIPFQLSHYFKVIELYGIWYMLKEDRKDAINEVEYNECQKSMR